MVKARRVLPRPSPRGCGYDNRSRLVLGGHAADSEGVVSFKNPHVPLVVAALRLRHEYLGFPVYPVEHFLRNILPLPSVCVLVRVEVIAVGEVVRRLPPKVAHVLRLLAFIP